MNALLYLNRTGVRRYLPHVFPPHTTVYGYFSAWTADSILEQLGVDLHRLVSERADRQVAPTACAIDAQSVKTATSVPTSTQGTDAGKKIVGRKRSIAVDTLGLLLAILVTAANVSDNDAGKHLLDHLTASYPTITKAWVDTGYKKQAVEYGAALGIDVEVVQRDPQARGFSVVPRRWVAERTFGWIMTYRRLARDYETRPERSEGMIRLATISTLARQATGETTIIWHNP